MEISPYSPKFKISLVYHQERIRAELTVDMINQLSLNRFHN